jgi:hypothetical protein
MLVLENQMKESADQDQGLVAQRSMRSMRSMRGGFIFRSAEDTAS